MAGHAPTGGAGDLPAEAARCNGEEYFCVIPHVVESRSVFLLSCGIASGMGSAVRAASRCAGCEDGGIKKAGGSFSSFYSQYRNKWKRAGKK